MQDNATHYYRSRSSQRNASEINSVMCKKNNINKMDSSQKFKYGLTLENLYLNKLNDKTVTSVKKKKKKNLGEH